MKKAQFSKIVKEVLLKTLGPQGFSCEGSKHCTFWRKSGSDIYHVIRPDRGLRGTWFDVNVFPESPIISICFPSERPDEFSAATNGSYLSSDLGVGCSQETFYCRTEEGLRRSLGRVEALLLSHGLPFLDPLDSMESLLPIINNPISEILLHCHLQRYDNAMRIYNKHRDRILIGEKDDPFRVALLDRLEEVLPGFSREEEEGFGEE